MMNKKPLESPPLSPTMPVSNSQLHRESSSEDDCQMFLHERIGQYITNTGKLLGKGAYADVYEGYHEKTGEVVAIKVLSLETTQQQIRYDRELQITKHVQHISPHIIKLIDHFETENIGYLVFEVCSRGEIFKYIQPSHRLAYRGGLERNQIHSFVQVVSTVRILHDLGVAHLDIKPENILIESNERLVLCDFGLSVMVKDGLAYGARGSASYAAPENVIASFPSDDNVEDSGYDGRKADVWSCGIVLFVFLYGCTPWDVAHMSCAEYSNYVATDLHPPVRPWNKMSPKFRTLFHGVLNPNPKLRWTIENFEEYLEAKIGWKAPDLSTDEITQQKLRCKEQQQQQQQLDIQRGQVHNDQPDAQLQMLQQIPRQLQQLLQTTARGQTMNIPQALMVSLDRQQRRMRRHIGRRRRSRPRRHSPNVHRVPPATNIPPASATTPTTATTTTTTTMTMSPIPRTSTTTLTERNDNNSNHNDDTTRDRGGMS
eukprot:m.125814 g.125814  ORF g.125814 m.125814 type:complete len:486 (+) comp9433_c3_seq1:109-1566(+)